MRVVSSLQDVLYTGATTFTTNVVAAMWEKLTRSTASTENEGTGQHVGLHPSRKELRVQIVLKDLGHARTACVLEVS